MPAVKLLPDEKIEEMRALRERGLTIRGVARVSGIPRATVHQYVRDVPVKGAALLLSEDQGDAHLVDDARCWVVVGGDAHDGLTLVLHLLDMSDAYAHGWPPVTDVCVIYWARPSSCDQDGTPPRLVAERTASSTARATTDGATA